MNKVMSLHDAVEKYVSSGDLMIFGGFTTNRKPYAAVYEILRQGQTDFTVWAGPAGGDWDMHSDAFSCVSALSATSTSCKEKSSCETSKVLPLSRVAQQRPIR